MCVCVCVCVCVYISIYYIHHDVWSIAVTEMPLKHIYHGTMDIFLKYKQTSENISKRKLYKSFLKIRSAYLRPSI